MNHPNETAVAGYGADEAERRAEEVVEKLNSLLHGMASCSFAPTADL